MEIRYDHLSDAMYIQLSSEIIIATKRVTDNLIIDLDEFGQAVGIELLNVQAVGIDPLQTAIVHVTTAENAERPDPELMLQGRIERNEARERRRQRQAETIETEEQA